MPDRSKTPSAGEKALAASRAAAALPFRLIGRMIARTIQVVFAIFVLVLHPFKSLVETVGRARVVQNTLKPAFHSVLGAVYEPYFAYLRELPPYWAAFSIALPLALLEPAKFVATIMIATRPNTGVLLWLFLQGVSFVLIDRTWVAVRPQARKIWLVSRLHALLWLNVAYGKHWIETSGLYRTLVRWREAALRTARASLLRWRRSARLR